MSSTKTKLKVIDNVSMSDEAYERLRSRIRELGYNDPVNDTDERQQRVFQKLVDLNMDLEIVTKHDLKNLGAHDHEYFKFFQTRAKSEEGVEEYFQQFYLHKKRLKRIIFGMILDDGKPEGPKLFIFLGNKRVRAHKMGIAKGHKSLCDVVIVDREDMTTLDKIVLAHKLARMGNLRVDSVRDEIPSADYPLQLESAYQLKCLVDPTALSWTEEEKIKWGKEWMIKEHPDYAHECKKSTLSNIVNVAFSGHRGQSQELPSQADINKHWQSFWPNDTWDPENSDKVWQFVLATGRKLGAALTLGKWAKREKFTTVRKSARIVARCGAAIDSKVTDRTAVEKDRKAWLTRAAEYNTNVNHIGAGYPRVDKVMFEQQISGGKLEAYEWNLQNEEFDKK
jgi:hypothetical protein